MGVLVKDNKLITLNGSGLIPALGNISISSNGTFDVAKYANAIVNISPGCKKFSVDIATEPTVSSYTPFRFVTGDNYVANRSYYTDLIVIAYLESPPTSGSNYLWFSVLTRNRIKGSSGYGEAKGIVVTSSLYTTSQAAFDDGSGSVPSIPCVNHNGDVWCFVNSSYRIHTGTWKIIVI